MMAKIGFSAVVVCAVMAVLMVASALWARVLVDMWRWFVTPFGIVSIGFWWAWGLMFLGNVFHHSLAKHKDEDDDAWIRIASQFFGSILGALVTWGFGAWIATHL